MSHDAALPPDFAPPAAEAVERQGILYSAARWSGAGLGALAAALARSGAEALRSLPTERLAAAWREAVAELRDPDSAARRALADPLARFCRLSAAGLDAGLEAVLGGVAGAAAEEIFELARPVEDPRPVVVVLAANLPALAVQPLLPALALRRPALLKSPSSEPLFAPAFVAALARREPALGRAVAAVTWPGGEPEIEARVLAAAGRVLAYGERETVEDLGRRAGDKLVAFGPKTSLAAVSADLAPEAVAAGLARDVALFDQRGCLSIQSVYTDGDPRALADALAAALDRLAGEWPPGPFEPAEAAGVQQLRAEAELRGLYRPPLPFEAGTVVVEPLPEFRPSPGMRAVRVQPLEDLERLPEILLAWDGQLQGAALAGAAAEALAPRLESLGLSRLAPPGELQSPDALWHNGGAHPLEALGGQT